MKTTLLLIIIALHFSALAQDTTYYGKHGVIVENKSEALTYKIIVKDKVDTNKVNSKFYYPSDKLKFEDNYSNYTDRIYDGESKIWYETGEIKEEVTYKNGEITGELISYWQNGKIRRIDKYKKNGDFKKGKVWDSLGNKVKYYDYYQSAHFNKEFGSLGDYTRANLQYPQEAIDNNEQGRVRVSFIVDNDGSIYNIEILESVSEHLDKEAIRFVKEMPNWIPAKQDGENSRQRMAMPFNFKL